MSFNDRQEWLDQRIAEENQKLRASGQLSTPIQFFRKVCRLSALPYEVKGAAVFVQLDRIADDSLVVILDKRVFDRLLSETQASLYLNNGEIWVQYPQKFDRRGNDITVRYDLLRLCAACHLDFWSCSLKVSSTPGVRDYRLQNILIERDFETAANEKRLAVEAAKEDDALAKGRVRKIRIGGKPVHQLFDPYNVTLDSKPPKPVRLPPQPKEDDPYERGDAQGSGIERPLYSRK